MHNNHTFGGAGGRDGAVEDADAALWDAAYESDVRGYMFGCKYAIPHLRAAGGGLIVNMGSDSARAGDLTLTAYGVTKAAVLALTQYVATQYGKDGIRCVSLTPGAMLTPSMEGAMGPEGVKLMERHHLTPTLGRPINIGALVAHLAGDEADFITGINIPVDGGLLAHNPTTADFRAMYASRP
jgi:NAD(P)-dependent dehydrogenase (short-subunit alcohol dehydrogenase family)